MRFPSRLLRGTLIQRYQRFLADVRLASGEIVTAHCTNTGSMMGCKEPGSAVYISRSDNLNRKLLYTWELISACGLLDRPEVIQALGDETVDSARRELDAARS